MKSVNIVHETGFEIFLMKMSTHVFENYLVFQMNVDYSSVGGGGGWGVLCPVFLD